MNFENLSFIQSILKTNADSLQATILHLKHQLLLPEQHRVLDEVTDQEIEQQLEILSREHLRINEALKDVGCEISKVNQNT